MKINKSKGISLIVLIVTIIVIIILAAVVILTLSKNNPIESAKEARFKEDVRTFQDELALYISKQYANAGGHWDGSITAKTYDEIVEYIPSFTKKYNGKFVINKNNLEYTNKLDEKEKEYSKDLNVKERLLPLEYQQIEYIESTGTQYIDTTYVADDQTNVEYKMSVKSFKKFGPHLLSSSNDFFPFFRLFDNSIYIVRPGQSMNINMELIKDVIYEYKFWNSDIYINNEIIGKIGKVSKSSSTDSLYLLTYGGDPSNTQYTMIGNVYYCKIYNNNDLKRNFIPCYSTTTVINTSGEECDGGTVGLYDTVEGKFYTNQGTGEFIAGPEVN